MTKRIKTWVRNLSFAFFRSGPHCVQLALSLRKLLIGLFTLVFSVFSYNTVIKSAIEISVNFFYVKASIDLLIGTLGIIGLCYNHFKLNLLYALFNAFYFSFLVSYLVLYVTNGVMIIDYLTFSAFSFWLLYRTVYDRMIKGQYGLD